MNRLLAVAVTAATATVVAGAAIGPAMAAPRTAGAGSAASRPAKSGTKAEPVTKLAARHAAASALAPLQVTSQLGNGQYVSVVQCQGSVKTPPPVEVAQPDAPLTVHGSGLSAGTLAALKQPNAYKTVYSCTVVVKERVPPKPKPRPAGHRGCVVAGGSGTGGGESGKRCKKVTLNTGFGGLSAKVAEHHPAG
jgi:hypothetical protein